MRKRLEREETYKYIRKLDDLWNDPIFRRIIEIKCIKCFNENKGLIYNFTDSVEDLAANVWEAIIKTWGKKPKQHRMYYLIAADQCLSNLLRKSRGKKYDSTRDQFSPPRYVKLDGTGEPVEWDNLLYGEGTEEDENN